MNYDAYTLDGVHFIEMSGEINAENCTSLKEEVLSRIDQSPNFLLNLGNVSYIDSTGIGTVMALADRINKCGGRLKLVAVRDNVKRILDLVNATTMLDLHEKSEEALRGYTHTASP